MTRLLVFSLMLLSTAVHARPYAPVNDRPPPLAREFRGVWAACVHNIDWPSSKGLSAATQQAELRAMLNRMAELKMNALIFQVRPHFDALYASRSEPSSPWLTGVMGRSPGYDPLEFCIREGHARGIEVHAWFNPFRALSNASQQASANHITRAAPHLTKRYGSLVWADPSIPEVRERALAAILDVVSRYDVDGVHIDDYFYPYPTGGLTFPDGKSPAQRRAYVDGFVSGMYSAVKKRKNWVRVGISPFGIWRPGVPAGIEAGVDSYEHLACDARKWLKNGWTDYLAPQLYWRISPQKQSFPALLSWWRSQGSRPVWPGIATSRVQSSEDPGRPASEIINQINLTRQIGKNWNGHLHWSAKAIMTNRGGVAKSLGSVYTQPAAVPPMPWINKQTPPAPGASASLGGNGTIVTWIPQAGTAKIAIQAKSGGAWRTVQIVAASRKSVTIPRADAVALTALDRYGNASQPKVLGL